MPQNHALPSGSHDLPEAILLEIVNLFKALSDPTRAQLVYLLTQDEFSVNTLSDLVPVSASAVSHHLAKLRDLRLVRSRRDGNQVFYSIDDSHVAALFREALFHLDHVRQNLQDQPYQPYLDYLTP